MHAPELPICLAGDSVHDVFDPGPGIIVFLIALFFAVIGATLFAVAICRGVANERRRENGH